MSRDTIRSVDWNLGLGGLVVTLKAVVAKDTEKNIDRGRDVHNKFCNTFPKQPKQF